MTTQAPVAASCLYRSPPLQVDLFQQAETQHSLIEMGRCVVTKAKYSSPTIHSLASSPNGDLVVAGCHDRALRVFLVGNSELRLVLQRTYRGELHRSVSWTGLSPSNNDCALALVHGSNYTDHFIEGISLSKRSIFGAKRYFSWKASGLDQYGLAGCGLHPSGELLIMGLGNGDLCSMNLEGLSVAERRHTTSERVSALASLKEYISDIQFTEDGRKVLVRTADIRGTVQSRSLILYQLTQNGSRVMLGELSKLNLGPDHFLHTMAPDGSYLLIASNTKRGEKRLLSVYTRKGTGLDSPFVPQFHATAAQEITALAATSAGAKFAVGGRNGAVKITSLADGSSQNLCLPGKINQIAFSPDGARLYVGYYSSRDMMCDSSELAVYRCV